MVTQSYVVVLFKLVPQLAQDWRNHSYSGRHAGFTNAQLATVAGFNVPQTGAYADEVPTNFAYELAVEHLNGGGDGGMLSTFSSKSLNGTGILGKKVEYVTGDTQTKPDAARASASSMIEKDGAIMITGGSSSGVAVCRTILCQAALSLWQV